MPIYNLTDYSDWNYSDTSGSLWQFKRDESPTHNNGNLANVNTKDSSIFKYKSSILGKATTAFGNERLKSDSHFPKKIVLLSWLKAL